MEARSTAHPYPEPTSDQVENCNVGHEGKKIIVLLNHALAVMWLSFFFWGKSLGSEAHGAFPPPDFDSVSAVDV